MLARLPLLSALLVALLAVPSYAADLPDSITLILPTNGTYAESTIASAHQVSFNDTEAYPDGLRQNVSFSITYPNGTKTYIGSVENSDCVSRPGATYGFSFNNTTPGNYILDTTVEYATSINGSCVAPFEIQTHTLTYEFTILPKEAAYTGGIGAQVATSTWSVPATGTYQPVPGASGTGAASAVDKNVALGLGAAAVVGLMFAGGPLV